MKEIQLDQPFCQRINDMYKEYMEVSKRYATDEALLDRQITSNSHTKDEAYFKATLINSFYSTRMGADRVYAAAQKIESKKELIQKIIEYGIQDNLEEITKFLEKEEEKKTYHPYSFFTKYLAIHRRLLGEKKHDLPIYDSFVEKIIKHSDLYHKEEFNKYLKANHCTKNFKHYNTLYWTIQYFAQKLTQGDFTDLDHILWLLGKTIYGGGKTLDDFNSNKDIEDAIKESIGSAE